MGTTGATPARRRPWPERVFAEAARFGVIGAFGVLVDLGAYAFFQYGWFGPEQGPLHGHEKLASVAATAVATLYAWVGNRYWAFRHRRTADPVREAGLFAFFNVVGALITMACVALAIDVVGVRGLTWESIARGVGIVLGTLFRFWAYTRFVFVASARPEPVDPTVGDAVIAAGTEPTAR